MHQLLAVHVDSSRVQIGDELNRLMPFFYGNSGLFFTVDKRETGIDIWSIIREIDWFRSTNRSSNGLFSNYCTFFFA